MWIYDELYSCPTPVLIGKTKAGNNSGFIVLPLANYRVNFLRKSSRWVIFHNIPPELNPSRSVEICSMLVTGKVENTGLFEKILAYSMIYGGVSLFLQVSNQVFLLNMEPVNTDVFYFYFRPSTRGELKEASLEDWSVFMLSIREGLPKLMQESCEKLGRSEDGYCIVPSLEGELIVSTEKITNETLLRVIPDNNPLRHVLKI